MSGFTDDPDPDPTAPVGPVTPLGREPGAARVHTSRRGFGYRRAGGRRWPLLAAAAVAVIVFASLADVGMSWNVIHPGVRVGDVMVGSLTPPAARAALEAEFTRTSAAPVTVRWADKTLQVTATGIGAHMDTTASVAAAMAVGRGGGVLRAAWDRIVATLGGVVVTPVIGLDVKAADAELDTIESAAAIPAHDASVSVSGAKVIVTPSSAGRALDRAATRAAILDALVTGTRTVAAVVTTVPATIGDAAAELARQQATRLIAGPVTVTLSGASVVIPAATVARWVVFSRTADAGAGAAETASAGVVLSASFDATRIAPAVASITKGRTRPAKDASFVAEKGAVRLVASQVGTGPDLLTLASDLRRACLEPGTRSAALRLVQTQPSLTTEAARSMGISDRISTFTTTYSTANPARVSNVHLLAKAFDAKLVAPGAVFSFNGAAGQRTAAKGYQEAPAIVDGKLVPQLGGGVCQVGTTFFNAVFFSGLPIVERHNHSFYISHYPKGRDATVSWGGPDFKFRNDTPNWILIRTAFTATTLTISLYGTDPGYNVEYTTGAFTDVVPFKIDEIKDPKLGKGARVMVDGGVNGCSVVVTRTVYLGSKVVRTDTFVSHYNAKAETVRVGTKGSTTPTGTAGN